MFDVRVWPARSLPGCIAEGMSELTRTGSDNHKRLSQLAADERADVPDDVFYAVISLDDMDCSYEPVGWVSVSQWGGRVALEGFVHPDHRGKKLATAAAAVLIASIGRPSLPVAVFSAECESLARRLGLPEIERWRRCDDGWVRQT